MEKDLVTSHAGGIFARDDISSECPKLHPKLCWAVEFSGNGAGLHKGAAISCQTRVTVVDLVASAQHPGWLGKKEKYSKKENMKVVFCTYRITPVSTTTKQLLLLALAILILFGEKQHKRSCCIPKDVHCYIKEHLTTFLGLQLLRLSMFHCIPNPAFPP